ncbi:unnamed protein product [Paramecium sonneborni]|uniref:Uncharacterized protein n=1 Tax=Paramecium sonneborni TaxID=65129 RepID=A0A8S1RTK7_9CILI|nr:unnamed protein product [Paramecium sonneborni]
MNQQIEVYSQKIALIPNNLIGFKVTDSHLTVSQMLIVNQYLISQLQKFGKIWNLIEPEIMGQIIIFLIGESTPFQRIFEKYFSFKLFCVENVNDKLIISTCQGTLIIYSITENSIQEKGNIQVLTSPIYRIHNYNQEIYLITDSQIKILEQQNYELIGGGSLKIDYKQHGLPVQILIIKKNYCFQVQNKLQELLKDLFQYINELKNQNFQIKLNVMLKIYFANAIQRQLVQILGKTAFASQLNFVGFQKTETYIFGFTQCGLIVQWNPENGQMNQAYKIVSIEKKQQLMLIEQFQYLQQIEYCFQQKEKQINLQNLTLQKTKS